MIYYVISLKEINIDYLNCNKYIIYIYSKLRIQQNPSI